MTLAAGTRLGPYEVLSPLGAGGMGEVYKARDTRLGRVVAVKVLPPRFVEDPELRRRFEREARAISQLAHPNICALFDVGSHDGIEYLVMELLEGQTLASRIEKGPLETNAALRVGMEIAEALHAAHRRGIVHRDLKPGNVMLTKTGVKLLDFGLAKTIPGPEAGADSLRATKKALSEPLTEKGLILGTFQYMSPEQLEGKDVDSRTDIFALGCVLYELTTGRRAFSGDSRASLIGAILRDEPASISSFAPMSPPALDHVVRRCLAKDPDDRWQSAADVASEIRWILESSAASAAPAPRETRRRRGLAILGALAGFAAALLVLLALPRASPPLRAIRSSIVLPSGVSLDADDASLTLSPDGRFLALAADDADHNRMLYLRALDSVLVRRLEGTEDAVSPFWSPDGRSIGFFAGSRLKRIEIGNGAVQTICDAPKGRGGTWGADGTIVFSGDVTGRLLRVAATGGTAAPLESKLGKDVVHRNPHFVPGGDSVLFTSLTGLGTAEKGISLLELSSKTARAVLPVASEAYLVPPGDLAYVWNGDVVVQPFDRKAARVRGQPVPIAEDVARSGPRATAQFSFAGSDLFVFRARTPGRSMQLTWFGPDGRKISDVGDRVPIIQLSVSPDGKSATEVSGEANDHQIWIVDLARGVRTRLTFGIDSAANPVWSSDSRRLAFNARIGGRGSIQVKDLTNGSPPRTVEEGDDLAFVTSWSPDGKELLFQTQSGETRSWDLGVLPLSDPGKRRSLLATGANEGYGAFSPDGRWIAFWSDESGRTELYVTPYPGPGGKWQISSGGTVDSVETNAAWWNGSGEIDYLSPDWKVLGVHVKLGAAVPEIASPRPIPGGLPLPTSPNDYSPALKRFLVAVPAGEPKAPPITVVTNWAAVLEKR